MYENSSGEDTFVVIATIVVIVVTVGLCAFVWGVYIPARVGASKNADYVTKDIIITSNYRRSYRTGAAGRGRHTEIEYNTCGVLVEDKSEKVCSNSSDVYFKALDLGKGKVNFVVQGLIKVEDYIDNLGKVVEGKKSVYLSDIAKVDEVE